MQVRPRILAHHLVISGYGFWLANDPRGSGSVELREHKFEDLGEVHVGRKSIQPSRAELRAFYARASPRLEHAPIWFNEQMRQNIGIAVGEVVRRCRYTVWACFIGSNHCHLCVRVHRDSYQKMHSNFAAQSREALVAAKLASEHHPVWAERPYSVYLHSPQDIRRVIGYVRGNAAKEGLPAHEWGFVKVYDGWPDRK